MEGLEFSDVLNRIRLRHRRCKWQGSPMRFVYHGAPLGKGVGVSFVDPLISSGDDEDYLVSRERDEFIKNDPTVLSIAPDSDNPIGVKLAGINPFIGFREIKRDLIDAKGNRLDPIVLCWVKAVVESRTDEEETDDGYGNSTIWLDTHWYNRIRDFAYNDFTNRAFNYLYIKSIAEDKELTNAIQSYEYFTDGCRVSLKFGYSSCAYAVALYKSLMENRVLDVALHSYDAFTHFHPYDQITAMCERRAKERFAGAVLTNLEDPLQEVKNEDVAPRRDYECDRDDDLGPVYYVDDTPVYGAMSQEEAEIEYWNTH